MTTNRPNSTYTVFPYDRRSSASTRRKSTRTVRYKIRARPRSTQIQIRRNAQMEFWKLVKPINQATITTRLYHEVLTDIYKDEVDGQSRPGTAKHSIRETGHGRNCAIEEAYEQLKISQGSSSSHPELKRPRSQPVYPPRQDSLLPPPPLAMRRKAYHDGQRRDREMVISPLRNWHGNINMSTDTLTPAPLNFSRPDRKGFKDRTTPISSPTSASFPHSPSLPGLGVYGRNFI